MDQPAAEKALKDLEPLVGEWTMEAIPPGGEPWPGQARAVFDGVLLLANRRSQPILAKRPLAMRKRAVDDRPIDDAAGLAAGEEQVARLGR
jgi:hypothetical protein